MGEIRIGNADGLQEVRRNGLCARRYRDGDVAIEGLRGLDGQSVIIDRADLDDVVAALQALRPTGSQYASAPVPPDVLAAAERSPEIVRKIEASNERVIAYLHERLPTRVGWLSPDFAESKKSPDSSGFVYPGGVRRPIERYVRAAVEIRMPTADVPDAPLYIVAGTIEIGLHYERGHPPHAYRDKLREVGEMAARVLRGRTLDEDTADLITEDLDERIVGLWGDRPRFIEIWRGTGDDAEPLTQVYAPHGMPIARTA